ncbi:MAG TPA: FAD-dependent oxidoreductase [Candidatus Limnocylindrales bacterium]|jgi:sarcosine oxidase subunit beta|nr:FAD-dependent oxidoreductase [Candidatus Limnocylindrales bacterium]
MTVDPAGQLRLRVSDVPPPTADLVVVGAGVVGCATAFRAARAGFRTVVLDARPRPATLTTAAATGAYRLQFDNAEELALVREGVELYEDFAERAGLPGYDIGLRRQGYLFCARDDLTVERQAELVERQRGFGLDDVELLDGDEVRRRFPYIADAVRGARFRAGDGFIDQVRLAWGYALAASGGPGVERPTGSSEATFVLGQRVTGLRSVGARIVAVETHDGAVAAPIVVLATGPFLGRTAGLAGIDVPIAPTRRQKVIVADAPEVPADAPMTIDEETGAHWRPALGGAFVLLTEPGTPSDEPAWSVPTSADFAFRLLDPASPDAVAHVAPFWRTIWERGGGWVLHAGQYEYTPDHRPFVSATPVEGLWLNGGWSGHGVMGSAGGSRLLLDAITGSATGPEWGLRPDAASGNPFRLDRPMETGRHDVL